MCTYVACPKGTILILRFFRIVCTVTVVCLWNEELNLQTRKHSSRMRTVRCSDRCGGCTCPEGCTCLGVYLPACTCPGVVPARGGGVPAQAGVPAKGVYPSMHWGRTPPLWTEWQTPVKILPCRNFVTDSNKDSMCPSGHKAFCTAAAGCTVALWIALLVEESPNEALCIESWFQNKNLSHMSRCKWVQMARAGTRRHDGREWKSM